MSEDTPEANKKKRLYYRGQEWASPALLYQYYCHNHHLVSTQPSAQEQNSHHQQQYQSPTFCSSNQTSQVPHHLRRNTNNVSYHLKGPSPLLSIPNLAAPSLPSACLNCPLICVFNCSFIPLLPVNFLSLCHLVNQVHIIKVPLRQIKSCASLSTFSAVEEIRSFKSSTGSCPSAPKVHFHLSLSIETKAPTPSVPAFILCLLLSVLNAVLYRFLASQLLKFGHLNKYLRHLPPVR